MSQVDAGFLEVLASCTGAEGEVDYADDWWMPPIGDYTCVLEKLMTGTKERDGITYSWAKVVFRLDRNFEGWKSSFGDYFRFSPDPKDIATKMTRKRFLALAMCLSGQQTRTFEEAYTIITEAVGSAVVSLQVEEYVAKKTKKRGQSVRYLSRVDAE